MFASSENMDDSDIHLMCWKELKTAEKDRTENRKS